MASEEEKYFNKKCMKWNLSLQTGDEREYIVREITVEFVCIHSEAKFSFYPPPPPSSSSSSCSLSLSHEMMLLYKKKMRWKINFEEFCDGKWDFLMLCTYCKAEKQERGHFKRDDANDP